MRHILVDMARTRGRQRRGAGAQHVALDEALIFSPERAAELVTLDEALTALAKLDERKSRARRRSHTTAAPVQWLSRTPVMRF